MKPDRAPADTSDREIVVSRVFDAPWTLVFKAWTDLQHLAHWWGPNSFSITTHEMEFKPGGVWLFVMHGTDGRDYQNKVVYVEIVEPERLVYDYVSGPQFRMTVTFADRGGKMVKEFGVLEGLKQTIGRLSEYLTQMKGAPSNEW